MKKRLLSLVLCLVMVFSLFPAFGMSARAEGEYDFAPATDENGGQWTIGDITSYESNGNSADQYALSNDLYYKVGDNYYPVDVVSDPDYYYWGYSGNSLDIYGNFTKDSPGTFYKTWGHDSQAENSGDKPYYFNYNGSMRKLYYNQEGDAGTWRITIFFYNNYEDKETASAAGETVVAYEKSTRNSSPTWDAVRNAGTVSILTKNGSVSQRFDMSNSYDQGSSHDEWEMGWWTYGLGHRSDNYEGARLWFKAQDSSKKAIIYTDNTGAKLGYVAQNLLKNSTTATSPGNPSYDGPLYYMRDLNQVPVVDPDATPTPDTGGDGTIINPPVYNDEGFKLTKALDQNDAGTYDLKMQSYSTANTVKFGLVEKVPTDFVIVVDQSGSMSYKDMPTGYTDADTVTLEDIAQDGTDEEDKTPYYYFDGANYYRVYATKDYLMEYHATETKWTKNIINDAGYDLSWFQGEDETSFTQDNQYYYKTSDGVYRPVHVTATGKVGTYYIKFYYENASGQQVYFTRPSKPVYKNVFGSDTSKYTMNSLGYPPVNAAVLAAYPDTNAYTYSTFLGVTTGMYINYPMYTRHVGYSKLCYRDVNGVEHVIGPDSGDNVAEYCNSSGQATTTAGGTTRMNYSGLYTATGYQTRISALKAALNSFVKAVAAETDTKNGLDQPAASVDNRIAIVGFSSYSGYDNTEILTGTNLTVSGNNGVQMADATTSTYQNALVSAAGSGEDGVNQKLYDAIDAITANGGTQPEYGFQMAKNIYDNRGTGDGKDTYTLITGEQDTVQRNKIVVFFTDGHPGDYKISNMYEEANDVVASALPLKTAGAKIFSIGVFGESDGNPLTYYDRTASSESDTREWKYLGGWMETYKEEGFFSNTYYCLRRQWRPAGAEGNLGYTPTANDTIFDYMSVTSSNYPGAQNFIAPGWLSGNFSGTYTAATDGVRSKTTAEPGNRFYRMASTQATLVEAFEQSVSYASSQQQHTDVVNMDTTAIFRDVINTKDFDISNATYSVVWQPIKVTGTPGAQDNKVVEWDGDSEFPKLTKVENRPVPANGVIEYSGFDYANNFVTNVKTKGYKLVVTVTGLVPTTYNKTILSNADDPSKDYYACGIYEKDKDEPAYSVQSPTLLVEMHEPRTTDVEMSKRISDPNPEDGSYTITLDAYAKGNSNQGEAETETTGTDVVIVVDKSSSMNNTMGTGTRFSKAVDAINTFITEAAANANAASDEDDQVDHRIAIIRGGSASGTTQVIAYNGSETVNYADIQSGADNVFKSVKSEGSNGPIKAALTAMDSGGNVNMNIGPTFDAVNKLLNGRADQSRKAIVIYLGDGKPNGYISGDAATQFAFVKTVKNNAEVFAVQLIDNATTTNSIGFMKSVSSSYPNGDRVGSDWVTGTKREGTVEYYQDIQADSTGSFAGVFTEVMETIDVNVNLDQDAYMLDVINLDNLAVRSDLSNPEVHVYTLKGTADANGNVTFEDIANKVEITDQVEISFPSVTDQTTGETHQGVKITGFDYSANYIGYPKPANLREGTAANQGKKLIVTISGLVPVHPGESQTSNIRAGVYDKEDDPAKEVPSPIFNVADGAKYSYVIDFSAPMIIATQGKSVAKMSGENGDFTLINGDVIYQFSSSVHDGKLTLNGVDQAFAYAIPENSGLNARVWSVLTTIPAGSVYFDDDYVKLDTTAVNVGDGSGYNAGIAATPADKNEAAGTYTFTFYGTGIDVYCTTAPDGGMIQARIDEGKTNGQADLNKVQSVRNYDKEVTRYNVPTISFRDLGQGEHTLELRVMSSSNYKLDGIRVYNPVSNETYEGQGTHEQYATFINMRDVMVNNAQTTVFTDEEMTDAVLGALFIDDASRLNTKQPIYEQQFDENGKLIGVTPKLDEEGNQVFTENDVYASVFVAYEKNSPKHEIYLDNNEAITFVLSADAYNAAASGNLWIGLSAPDAGKQSGIVEFKAGVTQTISTAVDEYYPITTDRIGDNRTVTIKNIGDNMISVTNLKITGNQTIYNAANTPKAGTESISEDAVILSVEDVVPMVFEPVTMQTVKIAANDGVDPDAPAPDPTPTPGISELVRQLISNFVSYLFQSVARLFHP